MQMLLQSTAHFDTREKMLSSFYFYCVNACWGSSYDTATLWKLFSWDPIHYIFLLPFNFTAKSILFIATLQSRSGVRLKCHALLITTWLNSQSCRVLRTSRFYSSGIFAEPNQPRLPTHLSEKLLQKGSGPAVVEVPALGRVADVGCVQQQGQSFGFVDAVRDKCLELKPDVKWPDYDA